MSVNRARTPCDTFAFTSALHHAVQQQAQRLDHCMLANYKNGGNHRHFNLVACLMYMSSALPNHIC